MGILTFKYGTMKGGKTADLLMSAYHCQENNFKVYLIKPTLDTRNDDKIKSRIGLQEKALLLKENQSIYDLININGLNVEGKYITYIFIDEVQFLNKEQVKELFSLSKIPNINIVCYGLRLNYLNKGFVGSKELLIYADEIEEIKTICKCGEKAITHLLKINGEYVFDGEEIYIGDKEFESVCYLCYDKRFKDSLNNKKTN